MTPLDCLPIYEDAELYDLEFGGRVHEIPFYLHWARLAGGPVLEVACGTGRLTVPIAEAGIPVAGIDIAPAMLARARLKSAAVDWQLQDARTMELGRQFAMIFMASNALQHLQDTESILSFLDRARRHLKPEGVLILDVFNPSRDKLARTLGTPYPKKEILLPGGGVLQVSADSEYLPEGRILHFVLTYRREGRVVHTKDVRMRCFFPEELPPLCHQTGLTVVQRFGDYDERPFEPASPKQILVCRPTSP